MSIRVWSEIASRNERLTRTHPENEDESVIFPTTSVPPVQFFTAVRFHVLRGSLFISAQPGTGRIGVHAWLASSSPDSRSGRREAPKGKGELQPVIQQGLLHLIRRQHLHVDAQPPIRPGQVVWSRNLHPRNLLKRRRIGRLSHVGSAYLIWSYDAAIRKLPLLHAVEHVQVISTARCNNLIEQSHRSTRQQERSQIGFKNSRRAQKFLALYARISNLQQQTRTTIPAYLRRSNQDRAHLAWQTTVEVAV